MLFAPANPMRVMCVDTAVLRELLHARAFSMQLPWCVQTLAELLTSDKLSELACLTLYLMYEKKNGKKSVWYEFIKVRAVCLEKYLSMTLMQ